MPPDPRVLLADVDRASADIERFTEGMDSRAYAGDTLTQAAVERKFEIIGKALNRRRKSYPEIAERIPRHRQIIDVRNLSIHGISSVAPERVRGLVADTLPKLRGIVQEKLAELGPPEE